MGAVAPAENGHDRQRQVRQRPAHRLYAEHSGDAVLCSLSDRAAQEKLGTWRELRGNRAV